MCIMLKIQSIYHCSYKYNDINTMAIIVLAHYTCYWICIIFFNIVHVRLVYLYCVFLCIDISLRMAMYR